MLCEHTLNLSCVWLKFYPSATIGIQFDAVSQHNKRNTIITQWKRYSKQKEILTPNHFNLETLKGSQLCYMCKVEQLCDIYYSET